MTSPALLRSSNKRVSFLQPAFAWTAILALIFLTAVGIMVGAGKVLNIAFPAGAFAVGLLLYYRAPVLYVGFTWWIWFLTAFIRRLADYRSGFTDPSPILIAPLLVTGITIITVLKYLPRRNSNSMPFIIAMIGVFYGFLVGLLYKEPFIVTRDFLNWITPITFGFHLFFSWKDYPAYRQNLQRTFAWGVLIMGAYGITQFISLPEWDQSWLFNTNLITAAGRPDELTGGGVRVWSTLNSGEPFAGIMAGALLLLLSYQSVIVVPASVAGYIALLLTTVRSAWLGWFAGLLILLSSLKMKFQIRLILMTLTLVLCILPLATMEPFSETINERFATFSNVEDDASTTARQETFNTAISSALTSFTGEGIGGSTMDNSILAFLIYLGWIGTILYTGGIVLLVAKVFQNFAGNSDPFIGASRAIIVSSLVRIPVNAPHLGSTGVMMWGFIGIALAGHQYYQYQAILMTEQSQNLNYPTANLKSIASVIPNEEN